MTLQELEKRMTSIEDLEAIKKLKMRYAGASDNKNHVNDSEFIVNEVFTEDGVLDGGPFGIYRGRKELMEGQKQVAAKFLFTLHYVTNPDIIIEGDEAHGRWCIWMPGIMTGENNDRGVLLAGYYEDDYVKIDGRWWVSRTRLDLGFVTDIEEGWHKMMMISD